MMRKPVRSRVHASGIRKPRGKLDKPGSGPPKIHESALVIIPPEAVCGPIQEIRRRHDRQVDRWMPHITLLYPFRSRSEEEKVMPLLRGAAAGIAPFDVTLAIFRVFSHGPDSFTVWLDPEPQGMLKDLQSALQSAFPDCDDVSRQTDGFTPHLSVGQMHDMDHLDERVGALQVEWQTLSFRVEEIVWIVREGEEPFKVHATVPLNTAEGRGVGSSGSL